jgi:flagellar hook-associated protein 3 FlgL
MRITLSMMQEASLRAIETNQERVTQLQNQLTTGSRISKPSDDPIGAARALSLQGSIDQTGQYLTNIDQATSWLNVTESALGTVTDLLQRARELAVQATSGTSSAQDRSAIDAEIQQLQQHALNLAQTKYGASFVFSGTRSDRPGYTQAMPTTSVPAAYQGNDNQIVREISPGVSMAVNTDSRAAFDPVFEALNQLHTGLSTNSGNQIQTSLGTLDTAINAVLTARAQIGGKTNRLDGLTQRLNNVKVNVTGLLSDVKDVDMAQAISNFSMAQNVYQASLKAGAQVLQPSLLDYLK